MTSRSPDGLAGSGRPAPSSSAGTGSRVSTARALALQALVDLCRHGGRANVVVPSALTASGLSERDRAFVTELVYGTLRMQRACDWLVDRHLRRPIDHRVRVALRLGAYQLAFLGTPPHAAVSATVAEVNGPARGLVNAVLRRVAADVDSDLEWPDLAVRLSYPDWIIGELSSALGADVAVAALEQMNVAAGMTMRADGYVQDRGSQWAAAAVGAGPGERIADLCAAPGGKATYLAYGPGGCRAGGTDDDPGRPSIVVAGDVDAGRSSVVAANASQAALGNVATVVADGCRPPFRAATFDRVLVDAPCSGLGALRRRPDARWRISPDDIDRLVVLQRRLLEAALEIVRPGGRLVYCVCTLTRAETTGIDEWLALAHPEAEPVMGDLAEAWEPSGRGARLLPQAAGTDGMFLLSLQLGQTPDRFSDRA